MRTKEFIIFLVLFTICYVVFFLIVDFISAKRQIHQLRKLARSLIKKEQYFSFATFYGIQGTASCEVIFQIFDDMRSSEGCVLSTTANTYGISPYEFVVVFLYLEYLNLFPKKSISWANNSIHNLTSVDQTMIQKYLSFFQRKCDFQTIVDALGANIVNDLTYINNQFLIPGVRYANSKVYYVGDYL